MPAQVNCENTSSTRYVTNTESASIRLNTTPGNGQSKSNPAFILIPLYEGLEHIFCIPYWKRSAVVFDIN